MTDPSYLKAYHDGLERARPETQEQMAAFKRSYPLADTDIFVGLIRRFADSENAEPS
jgi:hypothetical protein